MALAALRIAFTFLALLYFRQNAIAQKKQRFTLIVIDQNHFQPDNILVGKSNDDHLRHLPELRCR